VVHRLPGFDLNHTLQPMSTVLRKEHQIRVNRRRTGPDGYVLFGARIHAHFVPTAVLPLQESNNAVVLELLADRPH